LTARTKQEYGVAMTIELKPEQERILKEALRQGRFHSVEEALDCAIHSIAPEKPSERGKRPAGKKSLVEVFAPLRGMDLEFPRNASTGRPVDL
jgi:hypothetical protein